MDYVLLSTMNHFDFDNLSIVFKKNKIKFFYKSCLQSSLEAGWALPGSSFNEKMIFVHQSDLKSAKKILATYLTDYYDE